MIYSARAWALVREVWDFGILHSDMHSEYHTWRVIWTAIIVGKGGVWHSEAGEACIRYTIEFNIDSRQNRLYPSSVR